MNLATMSTEELRTLQKNVDEALRTQLAREMALAREQIAAIARSIGIPLQDILAQVDKRPPLVARYRNPSNEAQTWTGRGPRPQWIKELVVAGQLDSARL